jgi:hypothetical protein
VAALATPAELAALLKQDVDTASATQALDHASAAVRSWTRQYLEAKTYTGVKLLIEPIGRTWGVRLPERPVTAVAAVAVNGVTYVQGTDWAWNGLSPWIRLAKRDWTTATFQDDPVATVTYTAGLATIPDEVKGVVLACAAREYNNPTGLRSFSIDDHTEGYAGADTDLAGVSLLPGEKRLLRRYRLNATTVRT